jgi:predicted nucleotidyltransferase
MLSDKVRQEIRSRLKAAFQGRLKGILLFGSAARGEARRDSDLDLMVLLEGPIHLGQDLDTIVDALYPVQLEIEAPIHALPVSAQSFEAGEYGVYRRAKQEGAFL